LEKALTTESTEGTEKGVLREGRRGKGKTGWKMKCER
jgi:hypothetical protein